jgi:hypothetical protein
MSGNQYFTRVYNNVNGPSVVQQAQVDGGQALIKELVCYCEPRAATTALLNALGGTPVTLPVGAYVTEVIYNGNGLVGGNDTTYQVGLATTAGGAITSNQLTAAVALTAVNTGSNPALASTAAPAVSTNTFVSVVNAETVTTAGSLQVRILYV